MRIASIRLRGVRCFEDTRDILLGRGCNIFVGQNNSGKSTLLRSITDFEIRPAMREEDARPYAPFSITELVLTDISSTSQLGIKPPEGAETTRYCMRLKGEHPPYPDMSNTRVLTANNLPVFTPIWPNNFIVPFFAKRKASQFDQNVSTAAQSNINGTFSNLYARVDRVASPGMSAHEQYRRSVEAIVGVLITTRAAPGGKEAGYYFDDDNFVTLDRMGDGVSEMVALIVELSLAKDKVFVLEEPESNLHPKGLKALLNLVRESAANNQFIIATHSNVVVRELAAHETRIFRVYRDGHQPSSPSRVDQVEENPIAHRGLLRELGYEFGDFDLHDVWLFVEEASAETVIREILIPWFAPELIRRVRTFSAGGVTNLEPSIAEFQRLITFVHLEPVYRDRLWVRADGDGPGVKIIESLRAKFPYLVAPRSEVFRKPQFEMYYPAVFSTKVQTVLAVQDKRQRRAAKVKLLQEVLEWSADSGELAKEAWEASASEQIELLRLILVALNEA